MKKTTTKENGGGGGDNPMSLLSLASSLVAARGGDCGYHQPTTPWGAAGVAAGAREEEVEGAQDEEEVRRADRSGGSLFPVGPLWTGAGGCPSLEQPLFVAQQPTASAAAERGADPELPLCYANVLQADPTLVQSGSGTM